ncbi:hypothetical protein TNCV_5106731 [Trichonephila clavipes]|uniref:Uncharacterized protein n=1 Tax=Trichonephila clavipes TaxID=2585209 RepID=A0A8X6R9R1_TRICX|nr:hypothetical protein TNCV_5106731 [Trichonephila clavipes]
MGVRECVRCLIDGAGAPDLIPRSSSPVIQKLWFVAFKWRRERKRREREEPGLGWRKGKSPELDGENMRGEPWLERTGRER